MFKIFKKTSLLLLSASFIGICLPSILNVSAEESTIFAQTTSETLEETLREAIQTTLDNKFVTNERFNIKKTSRKEWTESKKLVDHGLRVEGYAQLDYGSDFKIRNFRISNNNIYFDIIFSGLLESNPKINIRGYNYGKRLGRFEFDTSADVEITAKANVKLCRANNKNSWRSRVNTNRRARNIYMSRTINFEGYSSQEIEDFVEDAIKLSIRSPSQSFIVKNLLEAIHYNDSVKSEYQKLTNLPNCQ